MRKWENNAPYKPREMKEFLILADSYYRFSHKFIHKQACCLSCSAYMETGFYCLCTAGNYYTYCTQCRQPVIKFNEREKYKVVMMVYNMPVLKDVSGYILWKFHQVLSIKK